jgi:hypothetical protein
MHGRLARKLAAPCFYLSRGWLKAGAIPLQILFSLMADRAFCPGSLTLYGSMGKLHEKEMRK